jgi:hypothetical protein
LLLYFLLVHHFAFLQAMEQAVEQVMISRLGLELVEIQFGREKHECFAST